MKKIVILLLSVMLIFSACKKKENPPTTLRQLSENCWAECTYNALNQMIVSNSNQSSAAKSYAVLDFDNTTIINDIQEATIIYQIENLLYKIQPEKMFEILVTDIPDIHQPFAEGYENSAGEILTTEMLATDITSDYDFLFHQYSGFNEGGTLTLEQIHQTKEYVSFRAKMRFLYSAVNATFDASVGYPWVLYQFAGMTTAEVETMATQSMDYWLNMGVYTKVRWTSSETHLGISGVVTVSYKTGIHIPIEMQDLYNTLTENGIDVYICSASMQEVIQAIATNPKYGLNVPQKRVFAMRLKKDANGKIINAFDENYFFTYAEGKVQTINQFIRPQYQGNEPILVAGDSGGDYNMMTAYPEMKIGLIINRVRSDSFFEISKIAVESLCNTDAKYLLQGRDENQGRFRSSESSILMGETEEQLLWNH